MYTGWGCVLGTLEARLGSLVFGYLDAQPSQRNVAGDGEGDARAYVRHRYLQDQQRRLEEQEADDLAAIIACMELFGMFGE